MATAKRSRLDELADQVEVQSRPSPGSPINVDDLAAAEKAQERGAKVEYLMRYHGVPRPIAEIMADTGYSKGSATRIWNDAAKRLQGQREAEILAAEEAAKRRASRGAEATA